MGRRCARPVGTGPAAATTAGDEQFHPTGGRPRRRRKRPAGAAAAAQLIRGDSRFQGRPPAGPAASTRVRESRRKGRRQSVRPPAHAAGHRRRRRLRTDDRPRAAARRFGGSGPCALHMGGWEQRSFAHARSRPRADGVAGAGDREAQAASARDVLQGRAWLGWSAGGVQDREAQCHRSQEGRRRGRAPHVDAARHGDVAQRAGGQDDEGLRCARRSGHEGRPVPSGRVAGGARPQGSFESSQGCLWQGGTAHARRPRNARPRLF
mmetsp:Transcript_84229/g.239112  ORF Transcript_84229/g.239112 Transcript_84229/m.239112 type:complete len:265 (+) Transcript_84229:428-1222(+)